MTSAKEQKRRSIARAVFREAWRYHRRTVLFTLTLATSLKIAWQTVRSLIRIHYSKVYGVKRRQDILWKLKQYRPEDVILYFSRQRDNMFDPNAVQIIAAAKHNSQEKAVLGYLQHELAAITAPALDSGMQALVIFDRITGAGSKGLLGCNFSYLLI